MKEYFNNIRRGVITTTCALWIGGLGTWGFLKGKVEPALFFSMCVPAVTALLIAKDPDQK